MAVSSGSAMRPGWRRDADARPGRARRPSQQSGVPGACDGAGRAVAVTLRAVAPSRGRPRPRADRADLRLRRRRADPAAAAARGDRPGRRRSMPTPGSSPIRRRRSGSAPLADVPCLSELPRLVRLRYLTALNRWTTLTEAAGRVAERGHRAATCPAACCGGSCSAATTSATSPRSSSATGTAAGRSWSCGGSAGPRFADADVAAAAERAAAGDRGATARPGADVRRAHATTRTTSAGPLVLLLSPGSRRPAARRRGPTTRCDSWCRATTTGPPVPAGAYNVAAQLLAVEAAAWTRIRRRRGSIWARAYG